MQSSLHCNCRSVYVYTLFISCRRICSQSKLLGSKSYRLKVKNSTFKHTFSSVSRNARVYTTNNTRINNRLFAISNNHNIFVKFVCLTVQNSNFFTSFCLTNTDFVTIKIFIVKSMHRLTLFNQNIICNINHIAYRFNSHSKKSASEPKW